MLKLIITISLIPILYTIPQNVGDRNAVDINNIYLPLNNAGVLADVNYPPFGSGGQYGGHIFLFCGGFLLSGYDGDSIWTNGVASAALITDYLPGTVNTPPEDSTASLYRVSSGDIDFGQSWLDWKDAVLLGADFYDGDGDGIYNPVDLNSNGQWDINEDKPDLIGDLMFWCVYNDSKPKAQRRYQVDPKGIEIRQTVFAFADPENELANTIFIRYGITNTGTLNEVLDSVYFSLYADPDIGDPSDDIGGSDTLHNSTIAYNSGDDLEYGNNPPAFYMKLLAGAVVYIPGVSFIDTNGNGIYDDGIDTPIDSAYNRKGELGVFLFPGATNLNMKNSVSYPNGDPNFGDPAPDHLQARNVILGYTKDGNIIDPCTWQYGEVRGGVDCSLVNPFYWYSGDPITDVGWINIIPNDIRILNTTGPFKLVKNQPVELMTAYLVGRGNTALNSVAVTKNYSAAINTFFENNFGYQVVLSSKDEIPTPEKINLSQNYPNPFNPVTIIRYATGSKQFVTLKVFDVLGNEVATLVNEEKPAGEYEVEFNVGASHNLSLSSGIYFYQLNAGSFVQTKKMILLK